jgi:hypothetical protein
MKKTLVIAAAGALALASLTAFADTPDNAKPQDPTAQAAPCMQGGGMMQSMRGMMQGGSGMHGQMHARMQQMHGQMHGGSGGAQPSDTDQHKH